MITVKAEILFELVVNHLKLMALTSNGVENWEKYDKAIDAYPLSFLETMPTLALEETTKDQYEVLASDLINYIKVEK